MPSRGGVLGTFSLVFVLLLAGCVNSADQEALPASASGHPAGQIIVGSFDFPESVLLAHLYAGALAGAGFPTRVLPSLGTRELVDPALMNGLIHIVPEYAGSALDFISLGELTPSSDQAATHASLTGTAARRGLIAAQPAAAQNSNAIVVTEATASRLNLSSIEDLAGVASTLVFGGPPECPQRRYCLPGLERAYGLRFKSFVPTDAGGPLTRQALNTGQIDVGLLFTTDAQLATAHFMILADNRRLQPAENVTPLVNREMVATHGQGLLNALDAVSTKLSTGELSSLNLRAEDPGLDPSGIADEWLRDQGLVPGTQGRPGLP